VTVAGDDFRRVMGRFATGVTIVTSRLGDESHGMTANAVTSVSLDPPLVLVCVDEAADSHDIIERSGSFAVSILGRDQEHLSRVFAVKEGPGAHSLDDVPHHVRVTGAPIIDGSVAYLDCRVVDRHQAGDHTIFIGEVVDASPLADQPPLLFFEGEYRELA
jgi:flavin reductase (DIM6/NTAB) family NADH-FMN oxidoreductase RutF